MSAKIADWVAAEADPRRRELRQAIHIVLLAMSEFHKAGIEVVMKGGVLLAVGYDGDRYTRDIDFSTRKTRSEIEPEVFVAALRKHLAAAAEKVEYGLNCRVQSAHLEPKGGTGSWPMLGIKVGYAPLSHPARTKRLESGAATETVTVEICYNEAITDSALIDIGDGIEIEASTLPDLIAEKFRAMIQQPIRNRVRRQDAYDIYCLLGSRRSELDSARAAILDAIICKALAREINARKLSLRDPEVKRRSLAEYPQLQSEILQALPDFEVLYETVCQFYETLPWPG